MDAPQEGQAGENRPPPWGAGPRSRRGTGRGGSDPGAKAHQAFLPGLENLGPGWTVFGPDEPDEDEEPATAPELPQAAVPAANGTAGTEQMQGAPQRTGDRSGSAAAPTVEPPEVRELARPASSEPPPAAELVAPAAAAQPDRIGPAEAARSERSQRVETGSEVVSAKRREPWRRLGRKGLPLPWATVLLVALVAAVAGVLTAHFGSRGPAAAGESPPPEPVGGGAVSAHGAQVEQLQRELAALRAQLEEARRQAESGPGAAVAPTASAAVGPGNRTKPPEPDRAEASPATTGLAGTLAPGEVREPTEAAPPELSAVDRLRVRRARAFDEVLRSLENGRAAEALGLLESLVEERVFVAGEEDGFAMMDALAGLWDSLERIGGASGVSVAAAPVLPALTEAQAGLQRARELRASFERESGTWLDAGGTPDRAAERLERLDRSLDVLAERLAALVAEAGALHEEDWQWLLGLGAPQDPTLSARHSALFGCEHAATITAQARDALVVSCLWSGEIDPQGLGRAQHLAAWGRLVVAKPPSERSAEEVDLLWLWYARRWYLEAADAGSFDWRGMELPPVLAPLDDWRAELRIAVELAGARSGWPPDPGLVAVHRIEAPGPAHWRADEVEQLGRAGATWLISRRHFDEAGAPLGGVAQVHLEREDQRYRYAGGEIVLLDLRAHGKAVGVAPCPLLPAQLPPPLHGLELSEVVSPEVRLGVAPGPCLVYRDGDWTRWFAPGFGLVREERTGPEGMVRIDLCALGSAP